MFAIAPGAPNDPCLYLTTTDDKGFYDILPGGDDVRYRALAYQTGQLEQLNAADGRKLFTRSIP